MRIFKRATARRVVVSPLVTLGWLFWLFTSQPSFGQTIDHEPPVPGPPPAGYYWRSDGPPEWGGPGGFSVLYSHSYFLMPLPIDARKKSQASPVGHILEYHDRDTFSCSIPLDKSKGENGYVSVAYSSWRPRSDPSLDPQTRWALIYGTMDHCNIPGYVRGEEKAARHVIGGYEFARIKAVDQVRAGGIWTVFFRVDPDPPKLSSGGKLQTDYETVTMTVYGTPQREQIWRIRVVH